MPNSELFFIANARNDLILARTLTQDDFGKSYEFLLVESSPNSISQYHVAKLKISIADPDDRPFFNEHVYIGKVGIT